MWLQIGLRAAASAVQQQDPVSALCAASLPLTQLLCRCSCTAGGGKAVCV